MLGTDGCCLIISNVFLARGKTNFFNASFLIQTVYAQFSLNLKNFSN